MTPRLVLHVDLDAFFVSVERVLDPSLCGKPVVVGGSADTRGVVAAASYEARAFGVRSAMPMAQALRLCPRLVRVSGSRHVYGRASRAVFERLERWTPLLEKVSVDEAYLDLTGCPLPLGGAMEAAARMQEQVRRELRLDLSVGIGANRLVAKVASGMAKPCGLLEVRPGQEARFLAPLPVRKLPGVGPATEERLQALGVRTVGRLAATDPELLRRVFGSWGPALAERARGVDPRPVRARDERRPPKTIGHERTFARDVDDPAELRARLQQMLEQALARLREHGLHARTCSVKLRYPDFRTVTRDFTLPRPSAADADFLPGALALLERLRRDGPVRLLGVRLAGLGDEPVQLGLFDDAVRSAHARSALVDRVRARYGEDAARSGDRLPGRG